MNAVLLLLLAVIVPATKPTEIEVDVAEINILCEPSGKIVLTQLILRRWERQSTGWGHHIAQWLLLSGNSKTRCTISEIIGNTTIYIELKSGKSYLLRVRSFNKTCGLFDPELLESQTVPKECRMPYFINEDG